MADHGMFPGVDLFTKRKIVMTIKLKASDGLSGSAMQTDIENKLNLCRRWFQPSSTDLGLVYRRRGQPDKIIYVRPKRRVILSDSDVALGLANVLVELHAADPMHYSLAVPTSGGTIAASATTATVTVTPTGEFPTNRVTLAIDGPGAGPYLIQNAADGGKTIRLNVNLISTDVLVIDIHNKQILLNGVNNYGVVRPDNQWWRLIQGTANAISFVRSSSPATAAPVGISWQDAWA